MSDLKTDATSKAHPFAATRKPLETAFGRSGTFFSLPALTEQFPTIARLPVSIRIVLESVLRNCDGKKVTPAHVAELANWQPNAERHERDPVRRRPDRAAGFHRRAAARRPGRDAQCRRLARQEP